MQILIIKLGAMGDVMRMASVLKPLKEKHPSAIITWVTKKDSVPLLKGNPYLDKIIVLGHHNDILKKEFDLTISFDDDSDACALASHVNTKKIIGAYMNEGKKTYTPDSAPWFDMGLISLYGKEEADRKKARNSKTYQAIHFSILGLKDHSQYPPLLMLEDQERAFAETFAKKHGISEADLVVGINTGAGGRWQDKKLSVDQTLKLISFLQQKSTAKILLFGGPDEQERNEEILLKSSQSIIDAGCHNTVREFAALVNLCDVVVTSDSLAMHIAIALSKKVVAFFYPTSAAEIEVYGKGKKIIAKGDSYCSYQTVCTHPPQWDIEEIAQAAISLMHKKEK